MRRPFTTEQPLSLISGLSIWPATTCMISELAQELLNQAPASWQRLHIILPTQRLQTWLLALLSQHVPAFIPPRFYNFDDFILSLARRLPFAQLNAGNPSIARLLTHGPLDPLSEELLIASLLRQDTYQHLRPGHEHEIRQLFAELCDGAISVAPDTGAYARLRQLVADDYSHCDESLAVLAGRIDELERLHHTYRLVCEHAGLLSAAALRQRLSQSVALHWEQKTDDQLIAATDGVYLVGFSSLAPCHARFLGLLATKPQVRIWMNNAPEFMPAKNPLVLLQTMLGVPAVQRAPTTTAAAPISAAWRLHQAPTPLAEAASALKLVQEAINRGIPPSQIAVLITNDTAYGPLLRCLLKDANIPTNLAITTPLSQSALGAWLRGLFDLLSGRQDIASVIDFMTQTRTLNWLKRHPKHCDEPAFRDQDYTTVKMYLTQALCMSGIDHSLQFMANSPVLPPWVRAACASLLQVMTPLLQQRFATLSEWQQNLEPLFEAFALFADNEEAASIALELPVSESPPDFVEKSAQTAARQFWNALTIAAAQQALNQQQQQRQSLSEFIHLIRDKMLGQEIRDVGDPLSGVQILSVEEARYVPFRYALILGAIEGQLPQAIPKDRLLDHSLKSRLGLPGWQLREAIEDTTFHLLLQRLPALEIFYPHKVNGIEAVRSRFIERLLLTRAIPSILHEDDIATLSFLQGTSATTLDFQRRAVMPNLAGHDPDSATATLRQEIKAPLSASALEKLLSCPYRFLLDRLDTRPLKIPQADDVMAEGDWLHAILEAFFTGRVDTARGSRELLVPPLLTSIAWDKFEDYVVERLLFLTEHIAPAHVKDSPIYLQLRYKAWPAYATHLKSLYTPSDWPTANCGLREYTLAGASGESLTLELVGLSEPLQVRGLIDSVDLLPHFTVITDYKRHGVPSPADAKRGIAPQLWLYAYALSAKLARAHPQTFSTPSAAPYNLTHAVLGYWSILKGEWTALAAGSGALTIAKERGLVAERAPPLETLEADVQRLWQWRLTTLNDTTRLLQADPSRCGFCDFSGICRKNDPQLRTSIARQAALNAFLGRDGADQGDHADA